MNAMDGTLIEPFAHRVFIFRFVCSPLFPNRLKRKGETSNTLFSRERWSNHTVYGFV
jgi:hypothetical protein